MTVEATGLTVRSIAEIAKTDNRAMLRMNTVPTAANTMFVKQEYVGKIYKNTLFTVDGILPKEIYITIKQL